MKREVGEMRSLLKQAASILWEFKRFFGFFFRSGQELWKSGWKRRNARYARYYHYLKINENLVFFEAFLGRGMLCGPYALFREMLNDPYYKRFKYVWVLDDFKYHRDLMQRYHGCKNVKFVKYMSRQYLKELCRAKYLVNNTTFASFFTKREGQVYITTWHGIPLKKLGFDMPNGANATSNIIRNFLQADYLISANPFLTDIYKNSYKLDGIYNGTIIEEGYPRLDTLVSGRKGDVKKALIAAGIHLVPNKKIILYAPTWKETTKDPYQVLEGYQEVKARIERESPQYQVLIKAHQFVYELIRDSEDVDYIIPATFDANEILPLADVLISDYSSIFFDYLYFERPVLFYIPDLVEYQGYRGLYFPVDWLPGPCSEKLEDVIDWLNDIDTVIKEHQPTIMHMKKWANCAQAGGIAGKILDIVIRRNEDGYRLVNDLDQKKKKILIHRGRMRVNGISTSCLNLLKLIDLDKYDVSIVVTESNDSGEKKLLEALDPRTRVLMRKTTFNYTYFGNVRSRMANAYGINGIMSHLWPKRLYQNEARRCFGNAAFDVAIDFEGYNLAYSLIVAAVPNALHAIWQHNDMEAERRLKFPYLKELFSCYPLFERIVSCSEAIMEVNRQNLATDKTWEKFVYAKNVINLKRISVLLHQADIVQIDGVKHLLMPLSTDRTQSRIKLIALEPYKLKMNSNRPYDLVDCPNPNGVVKSATLAPHSDGEAEPALLRFIAVGRLSPEKNYLNLIAAFQKFLSKGRNAVLYILGEGPQRRTLEKEITRLNLYGRVILTGNVPNPYAIMKQCDCFILPSLHEGQPMVILEARILGLPIIVSNFSSVKGSIYPGGQHVIGMSEADILAGLEAFTHGDVPSDYVFDAEQYNAEAYDEFLCAIQERKYHAAQSFSSSR